jgi:hypothetical protein
MAPNDLEKEVGEQPVGGSPSLAQRAAHGLRTGLTGDAAAALRTGSALLVRKGWDLVAPQATIWERLGYVGLGGYAVVYMAAGTDMGRAGPFLVPGAALIWCVAAWMIAPPPSRPASQEQATGSQSDEPGDDEWPDDDTVAALIRKVSGDQQGAHLEDILETGEFGSLSKTDLKWILTDAYGLPVESFGIRVDGHKRTRDGVRLRHLPREPAEPLAEASAEAAPSTPG